MTSDATGASERHEDRGAVGSPVERPVRPGLAGAKGTTMHFDQWWNSQAADAFRSAHPDMSGEQFRPVWDAAISAVPDAAKLREKGGDMRHYLTEAHRFAAMSPRGKENIATAIEILDELGA